MNKEKFLRELEFLLSDVSEEEREAALAYYRDYFDEAGLEHEQEVLESIGSPEKVAAELKVSLDGGNDKGEYTERGYYDERFDEKHRVPDIYAKMVRRDAGKSRRDTGTSGSDDSYCGSGDASGNGNPYRGNTDASRNSNPYRDDADVFGNYDQYRSSTEDSGEHAQHHGNAGQPGKPGSNGLLFLLLFIFIGLPLAGSIISAGFSIVAGIIGAVFGVFGGIIGLVVGGIAAVVGFIIGGVGLILTGVANMAMLPIGLMGVCLGLLMLAAAMLAAVFVKWGCTTAIPGLFTFGIELVRKCCRWIGRLIRKVIGTLSGRGGEEG